MKAMTECIRITSDMNPWIDALIFVPKDQIKAAEDAAQKGLSEFFSADDDSTYCEWIQREFDIAGIDIYWLVAHDSGREDLVYEDAWYDFTMSIMGGMSITLVGG